MSINDLQKKLLLSLAILMLSSGTALAGKIHIKNCAKSSVWVCIYNKQDDLGSTPRRKERFGSGEENDMGCKGDNCRIRVTDVNDKNCNEARAFRIDSKKYVSIQWASKTDSEIVESDHFHCPAG